MNLSRAPLISTIIYTAILAVLLLQVAGMNAEPLGYSQGLVAEWWNPIEEIVGDWSMVTLRCANIVLVFIVSLLVSRLAIKGGIHLARTYLPCILFVLLSTILYNDNQSLPVMLSTWSLIAASLTGIRSFVVKRLAVRRIFHAAFFFGLAVFFYPPAIYLTPLMLILLLFFRLPSFREWAVGLSIMALPVGLCFFALWVLGGEVSEKWELFVQSITVNDGSIREITSLQPWWLYVTLGVVVCLLLVFSVINMMRTRARYRRRSALGYWYFVVFALWSIAVAFASPVRSLYMLPLVACPLSIVLTTYFATSFRVRWRNFLFVLLLLVTLAIHLWGVLNEYL